MQHTAYITKKPIRSGKESIPDGALCGNGDLAVILGNSENGMRLYISKNDFWVANEYENQMGGITPVAYLDLDIPKQLYDNYHVEQRMDDGVLFASFKNGPAYIHLKIFVCAVKNAVLIEAEHADGLSLKEPVLRPFEGTCGKNKSCDFDGIPMISRAFDEEGLLFPTAAAAGIKKIKGAKLRYMVYVRTNHDTGDFESEVRKELADADGGIFDQLSDAHARWWASFWQKSSMTLWDEELELNWYASQYILAICARNSAFPPGLYGNFITVEKPNWKGDYHLNYNYEAPFYALCSSNHVELTDCYAAPLEDFLPRGRENARRIGCHGIFYPVAMGPKGMYSEFRDGEDDIAFHRLFLGQKSNAIHAADVLVFRWYATRDTNYAEKHIYPYLKECALFFDDYMKLENGQYHIYQDAIHEVPYYLENFNPHTYRKPINDTNNLLTLGLLRMMYRALIDISEALDKDETQREQWRERLEHLPDFATQRKKLKKVFRYTSKGTAWNNGNFLCLQHVYPAGAIGLDSEEELLKTARNTFFINDRWDDDNAINSVYPCAARLGVSPQLILKRMKRHFQTNRLENCLFVHGGGCIENNSFVASTINEMLLQSYEGVLRFFPCWDRSNDCKFERLRADGAFLVSARLKNGEISEIELMSEKGCPLTIENPYEQCVLDGKIYSQRRFTIPTQPGVTYKLTKAHLR